MGQWKGVCGTEVGIEASLTSGPELRVAAASPMSWWTRGNGYPRRCLCDMSLSASDRQKGCSCVAQLEG